MFFVELSVLSHNGKKTRHVEKSTQHSSLFVGNHRSTNRLVQLVFEMSLKIFYAVNFLLKVPRLIDLILTRWLEIAKQKYYLQDLQG